MRKKGSGTVASAPIEVTPFRAIEASHHFTVRVAIGSPESATLRIDDNLLDAVDVGVRDGTLRVGLRPLTEVTHATLEIDVTAPALDRVMASGASQVRIEGRNEAERVDLTLSGSSELTADLDVGRGHLELSGTSTATLSGAAGTLEVTVSGASHLYADELSVGDLSDRRVGSLDRRRRGLRSAVRGGERGVDGALRGVSRHRTLHDLGRVEHRADVSRRPDDLCTVIETAGQRHLARWGVEITAFSEDDGVTGLRFDRYGEPRQSWSPAPRGLMSMSSQGPRVDR